MAAFNDTQRLRELIRLLEQQLGVLDEAQSFCCGVTMAQCHTIVEVGRAGSISLIELAKRLNLDNSTLSRMINNLVNNQLVIREINPKDRRYITISLAEKGFEVFKRIEENMDSLYSRLYNAIPELKRKQMIESLELFIEVFKDNQCLCPEMWNNSVNFDAKQKKAAE